MSTRVGSPAIAGKNLYVVPTILFPVWLATYLTLQLLADSVTYTSLGLKPGAMVTEAVRFFHCERPEEWGKFSKFSGGSAPSMKHPNPRANEEGHEPQECPDLRVGRRDSVR